VSLYLPPCATGPPEHQACANLTRRCAHALTTGPLGHRNWGGVDEIALLTPTPPHLLALPAVIGLFLPSGSAQQFFSLSAPHHKPIAGGRPADALVYDHR